MSPRTIRFGCPRCLPTMCFAMALAWSMSARAADEWMYQRSYFSHAAPDGAPQHPLPDSRSAYRIAYYREFAGGSFRSAYRVNHHVITNGQRADHTVYREGWFEHLP